MFECYRNNCSKLNVVCQSAWRCLFDMTPYFPAETHTRNYLPKKQNVYRSVHASWILLTESCILCRSNKSKQTIVKSMETHNSITADSFWVIIWNNSNITVLYINRTIMDSKLQIQSWSRLWLLKSLMAVIFVLSLYIMSKRYGHFLWHSVMLGWSEFVYTVISHL